MPSSRGSTPLVEPAPGPRTGIPRPAVGSKSVSSTDSNNPKPGTGLSAFPARRMRRLRRTPALRRLVAETRSVGRRPGRPAVRGRRASTSPSPSARCPASCSTRSRRWPTRRGPLPASASPASSCSASPPEDKDARGPAASDPDGIVQRGPGCGARGGGRRDGAHRRSVPGRVHRSRPLRDASTRPRGCRQRRHPRAVRRTAAVAQADAGADVVAPSGMMDGQVGGHPGRPRRRRPRRHGHPGLRGQVRLGPVRPVPRAVDVTIAGGGDRKGYQQDPRNRREAMAEVAPRPRRGGRHGDGQAGPHLPRRHRRRAGRSRRARWRPTT